MRNRVYFLTLPRSCVFDVPPFYRSLFRVHPVAFVFLIWFVSFQEYIAANPFDTHVKHRLQPFDRMIEQHATVSLLSALNLCRAASAIPPPVPADAGPSVEEAGFGVDDTSEVAGVSRADDAARERTEKAFASDDETDPLLVRALHTSTPVSVDHEV